MKRIVWLVLAFLVGLFSVCEGANVSFSFTDSTKVEDCYIYSGSPLNNYGRGTSGATNRVVMTIGTNYSNTWTAIIRIPSFKDSCDAHSGLIIDSARYIMRMQTTTISSGKWFYIRTAGIDTNMNWGEGNNAAAAANCEACWDSARTTGTGTCATPLDWSTNGAVGTGDTMGMWTGKPRDSFLCDENLLAGEACTLYVDTQVMNVWKSAAGANEGFLILWTSRSGSIQASITPYGSETNVAGAADSVSVFQVFGHTAGTATGQVIIIGDRGSLPEDHHLGWRSFPDRYYRQIDWGPLDWGAE